MTKKILIVFAMVALGVASAAESYKVTLFQPSIVSGTELKAGDYKLELKDSKVLIRNGKQSVEADVKVEIADSKYNSTSVRYHNGDGKYRLQEIRIGGTKTKLVFTN